MDEYLGEEALRRAEVLTKVRVDVDCWATEFVDTDTGIIWILDYPESELQGGGLPRLHKKDP
ncbi:Imm27 family immunity protein [Rhizobium herbae]